MSVLPDILFVTHRVPYPPDKGDRIRTFHLLRFLAQHARVHLASLADEPVPEETLSALATLTARTEIVPLGLSRWARGLGSMAIGGTISAGAFRSKHLTNTIREWAKGTNFVGAIASASSVAQFIHIPELKQAKRIVDVLDVDSQKWLDYAAASSPPKSWLYAIEGRRLRKLERAICGWADAVVLVSENEAAMMAQLAQARNVYAITNGVDLDYYRPKPGNTESGCVFIGALDYFPNMDGIVWFARTIWPNVRAHRPEARLAIVGRKPVPAVRDLSAIPGVDVIGQVPDVRPYLAAASVVIAPLRIARGLQNKVLEAMSYGKAVVASPSALAGFGMKPDLPAHQANEPVDWVESLVQLLGDDALRQNRGEAGRAFAECYHDWNACLSPFCHLLGLQSQEKPQRETDNANLH